MAKPNETTGADTKPDPDESVKGIGGGIAGPAEPGAAGTPHVGGNAAKGADIPSSAVQGAGGGVKSKEEVAATLERAADNDTAYRPKIGGQL